MENATEAMHDRSLQTEDYNDTYACAKEFVRVSEGALQPTILAFGMLTNIASLVVLRRVKLTETFRVCLVALSISDLCATVFGFVNLICEVELFDGEMPFGRWDRDAVFVYALYYVYLMFICSSSSMVILIGVIRNVIVLIPLKARSYFTRTRTMWVCASVCLCTLLLFLPTVLNIIWQSCYMDDVTPICVRVNATVPNAKEIAGGYMYFLNVLFGPISFICYIACVISISVTLKRSTKGLKVMTQRAQAGRPDRSKQRDKTNTKITRTLLLILILDIICTLPTIIYGVGLIIKPKRNVFDDSNIMYEVFDAVAETVLCFRPAYNFWLYFFQNKEFRTAFRQVFYPGSVQRKTSLDALGQRRRKRESMSSESYRTETTTAGTWSTVTSPHAVNTQCINCSKDKVGNTYFK